MTETPVKTSAFAGSYRRVAEATGTYAEWRYMGFLLLLLGIMFLGNTSYVELEGGDETRVAGISRMMLETHESWLPKLNGKLFLEYPPLYYQLQVMSFKAFGVNDFAARLPSALAAAAGACLIYFLIRSMKYSPFTAFLSGIILASSSQYFGTGMTATVDTLLAMFCIMAWCGFYAWGVKEQRKRRPLSFLVLVIGFSGAIMTKNLTGIMYILSGIGVFMVVDDCIKRNFRIERYVMLFFALLLALLIPAAYGWLLYRSAGIEALKTMFIYNNFGRFSGINPDHSEPFYYYFIKLPGLFQPWLVFLLLALWFHGKRVWKKHSSDSLYMLSILLVPLLLLSCSAAKRQVYLLPLYAPATLLTGAMIGMFAEGKIVQFSQWVNDMIMRVSFYVIFALGLIVPITFVVLGVWLELPGWGRYWAAALMIVMTFRVWQLAKPRREAKLLVYLALIFALIYPNISGIGLSYQSRKNSLRGLFAEAAERDDMVVLIAPRESVAGAANYYMGTYVPEAATAAEVEAGDTAVFMSKQPPPDGEWANLMKFCDKYYVGTKK
ncbi:MAG: glycosyltransferase family 39 protein [Victivallaceae bacterium]|nr:glycosyltransferase family 39 protein [Victivallaceae bacterium]